MATLKFTGINHDFRRANDLSCNEYVLLDFVYLLSNTTSSKIPGWCYMKRETMAEQIGITKQGLLKMIDRLIEKGFLIRDAETKFLKTSNFHPVIHYLPFLTINLTK